jgi:hypothetical protein
MIKKIYGMSCDDVVVRALHGLVRNTCRWTECCSHSNGDLRPGIGCTYKAIPLRMSSTVIMKKVVHDVLNK